VLPDLSTVRFTSPDWLPLLAAPGGLLILWTWQFGRRIGEARRIRGARRVPVRERVPLSGDFLVWLCLLIALAATIVALARPVRVVSSIRTAGIDLVVLQDGSASMRVQDAAAAAAGAGPADRWQRSMRFLRVLGESLRWENDRIALALFAGIATPQIRLTRDPNTLFFFLDHLEAEPPFRLEDHGTWDTNIERGIYWGLRLIEKDEEIAGRRRTDARAFVLLSDGQAWSGEIERSLALARGRGIPLFVLGVGTTAGGPIPEPGRASNTPGAPLLSSLDRASLSTIATAGGGRYFELDREPDAEIANAIIGATRRRAAAARTEGTEDLYWPCLAAAVGFAALGLLLERDRGALAVELGAASIALALVVSLV
jgi:Ca-activated chloride channel family protein